MFGQDSSRLRLPHMTASGRCDWLVGGTPSEVPRYAPLSALRAVHPGCPTTLLLHGRHDQMAPVAPVRRPHERLRQAGVPVTAVYLPHTDHMFDLVAACWSPQARAAIHVLERFLAVLASTERSSTAQSTGGSRTEPLVSRGHAPS